MMIEEEGKREEKYLSFQREGAEKDRQHELLIAQIFANVSQPLFPYRSQPCHQGNSSTFLTSDPYQPVQDDIRRDSSLTFLIRWSFQLFQPWKPVLVFTLINIQAVRTAVMFMKGETIPVPWQPKS